MTSVQIVWEAQERQAAFIACPCFEVFFGGARGGGKTDAVLGDFISHADLYGENAIGLMVRRERTQLVETIERSKTIYSLLGWKFHEQEKMWRAPNGARLRFAYLERDSDADAYQGHSYSRVYVEEIGTFPSEKPILKLMATLRSGAGVPCGFRATGNPGGPGHHWVKARYIDAAPQGWKVTTQTFKNPWTQETVTRDRVFIPSKVQDNKFLGSDYIANLQMTGSANLVRAWLEGDWSVIEGAFFPEWSNEKHVISPFVIPPHWLRFRSMDWGSASPFSVGWWAVASDDYQLGGEGNISNVYGAHAIYSTGESEIRGSQGLAMGVSSLSDAGAPRLSYANQGLDGAAQRLPSRLVIPRGSLVRYREWYGASAPNVGLKMPAEEVGLRIKEKEREDGSITYGVLDPAAFASDGGPSIAERLARDSGIRFRPADNKRVSQRGAMGGWDQLRSRLIGSGAPSIYFFSTCTEAIRTLPALQHDPDKPEDVDSSQEDHAPDECVVADTLISTWRGLCPITDLTIGDQVWTEQGLCKVNAIFSTGEKPVFKLTVANGQSLTATANHPVYVEGKGFVRLASLRYGDMTRTWLLPSSSTERHIPATQTASADIGASIIGTIPNHSTEQYGNITGAESPQGISSTTRMATLSTIVSTIWKSWSAETIRAIIGLRQKFNSLFASNAGLVIPSSFPARLTAIAVTPVNHRLGEHPKQTMSNAYAHVEKSSRLTDIPIKDIAATGVQTPEAISVSRANSCASGVGKPAWQETGVPGFVLMPVASVTPAGFAKVYNLSVDDREEYFANGILTHNCRYACMSRPFVRQAEPAPNNKILGIGTHNQVTWDELIENQPEPRRSGRI